MEKTKTPPILGYVSASTPGGSVTSAAQPKETIVEVTKDSVKYAYWGQNNDLPQQVLKEFEQNEILFRANEFNKSIHVGAGLIYYKEVINEGKRNIELFEDPEIDDWLEENQGDLLFKNIVENYETLGNPISEMITNSARNYIARMLSKDAAWCRFEKQNPSSFEIERLYYHPDWSSYREGQEVKIPVLNSKFPYQDLLSRTKDFNFIFRIPPVANNRYYYDICNTEVMINSGTLDIYSDIKRTIKALMKNQATIVWHIEVFEEHFIGKLGLDAWEKIKADPKKRESEFKNLKDEIDKYLAGAENAGKTLMTSAAYGRDGRELHGVVIKALNNTVQQGAWIPDQQQCANDIYQGMGVDPSSVGGFGNKDRTMNSGSEKKNSFWNSNAVLYTERLMTFMPFYFVARVNGWTKRHKRFRWGVMDMDNDVTHQAAAAAPAANPNTPTK